MRAVWFGSIIPICVLVRVQSDVDGVLNAGNNRSLEALHDYRGEGLWPIVIQAFHCKYFGDGNDSGSLHTGGDRRLLDGGIEDTCRYLSQLVCPSAAVWGCCRVQHLYVG